MSQGQETGAQCELGPKPPKSEPAALLAWLRARLRSGELFPCVAAIYNLQIDEILAAHPEL